MSCFSRLGSQLRSHFQANDPILFFWSCHPQIYSGNSWSRSHQVWRSGGWVGIRALLLGLPFGLGLNAYSHTCSVNFQIELCVPGKCAPTFTVGFSGSCFLDWFLLWLVTVLPSSFLWKFIKLSMLFLDHFSSTYSFFSSIYFHCIFLEILCMERGVRCWCSIVPLEWEL